MTPLSPVNRYQRLGGRCWIHLQGINLTVVIVCLFLSFFLSLILSFPTFLLLSFHSFTLSMRLCHGLKNVKFWTKTDQLSALCLWSCLVLLTLKVRSITWMHNYNPANSSAVSVNASCCPSSNIQCIERTREWRVQRQPLTVSSADFKLQSIILTLCSTDTVSAKMFHWTRSRDSSTKFTLSQHISVNLILIISSHSSKWPLS
jgi:hypothetical protein